MTLTQKIADALCTAVVVGFVKDENKKTTTPVFKFLCEVDGLQTDQGPTLHDRAAVALSALGAETKFISVVKNPKEKFKLIVAKTQAAPTKGTAKNVLESDAALESKWIRRLRSTMKDLPKLYGAYIGVYSTISKTMVYGVSSLNTYPPKYRTGNDSTNKDSTYPDQYEKAAEITKSVNNWLSGIQGKIKAEGVPDIKTTHGLIEKHPDALPEGHLFQSFHGMIKAMAGIGSGDIETNKGGIFYEISLSADTTKVASCFPCCTYMTTFGKPPTATHLDRGDNWSIPASHDTQVLEKWEKNIKNWYASGLTQLKKCKNETDFPNLSDNLERLEKYMKPTDRKELLHKIFLEALTFENKFITKIQATLGYDEESTKGIFKPFKDKANDGKAAKQVL